MTKHKQVGPPVRIGDYMISVVDGHDSVLARAVNVNEHDILPKGAIVTRSGLTIEPFQPGNTTLPNDVLEALLKVGGWKAECPQ